MTRKDSLKLVSIAAIYLLLCGWKWPWEYGSKHEALQACTKWIESGPNKEIVQWEYRVRLKDTSGQESWNEYGLGLLKGPPKPGEWSPPLRANRRSDIPKPLQNEEIESWRKKYILPIRTCIQEPETRQVLGTESALTKKRFKY
jgi:hypothetical protein